MCKTETRPAVFFWIAQWSHPATPWRGEWGDDTPSGRTSYGSLPQFPHQLRRSSTRPWLPAFLSDSYRLHGSDSQRSEAASRGADRLLVSTAARIAIRTGSRIRCSRSQSFRRTLAAVWNEACTPQRQWRDACEAARSGSRSYGQARGVGWIEAFARTGRGWWCSCSAQRSPASAVVTAAATERGGPRGPRAP